MRIGYQIQSLIVGYVVAAFESLLADLTLPIVLLSKESADVVVFRLPDSAWYGLEAHPTLNLNLDLLPNIFLSPLTIHRRIAKDASNHVFDLLALGLRTGEDGCQRGLVIERRGWRRWRSIPLYTSLPTAKL